MIVLESGNRDDGKALMAHVDLIYAVSGECWVQWQTGR